jgi:hypothetical protein
MARKRKQRACASPLPRVPSDEELRRLRALAEYGRAMAIAKREGIPQLLMPARLRVRNPAPISDWAVRDKVMARVDRIFEERIKARLEAAGIPYTEERPYHHWVEPKVRARTPPRKERDLAAFDPSI